MKKHLLMFCCKVLLRCIPAKKICVNLRILFCFAQRGYESELRSKFIDVRNLLEANESNILVLENMMTSEAWPKGPKASEGIVIEGLSLVEIE